MNTKNKKVISMRMAAIITISVFAVVLMAIPSVMASPDIINVNETGWWRDGGTFNASSTPIQHAINNASSGDTINVAAGTYAEYLHITTDNLTVQGAGIDQSIIDLDGLTPYWHYGTCSSSFASRAGVYIVGYGSSDEIVENVTFKGFTVKNAGLNPPITSTGNHTGSNNQTILTDSTASWTPGALVGQWVHNYGDRDTDYKPARSYGQITANNATTVTATLSGGMENDWDTGDQYLITPYKHFHNSFWIHYPNYDGLRGISIANGKNILIQNCKVTDCGYGGITTGYARCVSTHKYSEGVTIDNCIVTDHPRIGINIGSNAGAFTVTNNTCERIKSPHYADPTREYTGSGIQVSGKNSSLMASGLIFNNTCNDNGFEGIIVTKYTDGVTVENNTVTGHNFDQDGAGIFFYHWGHPEYCKNHVIKNNTVTGNIRGIVAYYASDSVIEYNTITTDSGSFPTGQGAIKLDYAYNIVVDNNNISCDGTGITVTSSGSQDNTFTNNTIDGAMFAGIYIRSGAHDNTFEYNTITNTVGDTFTQWADWGTHDGGNGQAALTDSTKSWTANAFVGMTVKNLDDGSEGTITANTATTATATLSGGTENDWDTGDDYDIVFDDTHADGVYLRGGMVYAGGHAGTGNVFNYNNIYNNPGYGLNNQITTTVNATNNWWGANDGPSGHGPGSGDNVSANVSYDPWIVLHVNADPSSIVADGSSTSTITADMTRNSNGVDTSAQGHIPDGMEIIFTTDKGSIGSSTTTKTTTNGKATAVLTSSTTPGTATVNASAPPHTNAATNSTTVVFTAPPTPTPTPPPVEVPAITPPGFLLALISLFGLAAVAMRRVYKR